MSDKIDYFAMVEEAWALSDSARTYVKEASEAGREVGVQEVLEKVFVPSNLLDIAKCQSNNETPPKIYLRSPYGLQYRPEYNDWIPFRHGEIDLSQLE